MAGESLRAAASQANLSGKERDNVDNLSKLLNTHKSLLDLPSNFANQKYNSLPVDQKNSLNAMFGSEKEEPKRGFLGNAWHYTGGAVVTGLTEVSDAMTRLYRTARIANREIPIGSAEYYLPKNWDVLKNAWETAKDDGREYFVPERIAKATQKYGATRVSIAQQVAKGIPLDEIIANGSEDQKLIASSAAQKKDKLFDDALDAVKAAQLSPGRDLANLLLPEGLEGSGFLYTGISGTTDAAYRIFADPTILLGKAKKAYDAANYALFKIVGNGQKVDEVFAKPAVTNFFNTYGTQLDELAKARKAKDVVKAEEASTMLRRLAPEFGPSAIDEFIKAGVTNADTAKNYLANHADVATILKGQPARKTPLIPRLDNRRKLRVKAFTTGDKIINIDKVGQKIVSALYGAAPQYEDIVTGITSASDRAAILESAVGKFTKGKSGVLRFSEDQIRGRIDRFAAKFTTIPYFKDGFFDVMDVNASNKVYQVARLANSRYHSRVIAEAFAAGNEGQRKQIFTGLWNTVAEIRGVSKTQAGKTYMDEFAGRGLEKKYAADIVVDGVNKGNPANFDGQQLALFPYQLSSGISVPSIVDLDRLSVRSGVIGKIMGLSHNKWVDKLTSGWVIGTLAGPRFAIRNATEDLMMHLAIGDSPWGLVKGRMLSTRLRVAQGIGGGAKASDKLKATVTLDTASGELGVINKFIRKNELDYFKGKLDAAKDVTEVRKIMAESVLRSGLPAKIDQQGAQYIAEIAEFGYLDDTLRAVSEGGKNALRGSDQYLAATDDVARFGQMGAIEIDGVAYKQATGQQAFTEFNPVANEQARVSWLVQLGITSNDDLANIAVRYLDDEPAALNAMTEYLQKLPQSERERFQLYFTGATERVHAKKAYDAVRNLYSKRNGQINTDLLGKVRYVDQNGELVVSTKNLTIHDLPTKANPSLVPEFISGPTLVPVSDSGNFAASLFDKGWDAMGEANARFSREPIVINEMIQVRKAMDESGFADRLMSQLTRGKTGDELEQAQVYAKRQIVAIAEDLAKDRILAYVDNPAVRSQLAMSARNFARFYRATEDFYRRIYRTVKYNPESITRAALTYEGVSHSGFVQTDDNGDEYFFYPGLTPVYQTMNNLLKGFGIEDAFQAPMPVEFAGKLKMITPSMNPDSLFPTFAGPLAAVPMKVVFNLVPQLDSLERVILGTYAEDQPMINAVLPAHATRLLGALNKDERSSQYASAFRKAATYLEAAGHSPKPVLNKATGKFEAPTPGELQAYKDKIEASTLTVLAVRFLFGFVAPASPQVSLKSDLSKWVRENERTNYKQVYNNLVDKYGSIDKATEEWIRLFPDQMPFTVSESESNTVAIVRSVDQAGKWIEDNKGLLAKYPQGAAFLIPREGEFDFNTYKLLYNSGIKQSKNLYDFLRDVSSARDVQFYYQQQDAYEEELASTYNDYEKKNLREQWGQWSKEFKAVRPLMQEKLGQGSARAVERARSLQDLENMLNDPTVTVEPKTRKALKDMSTAYNNYIYTRDLVTSGGESAQNYKDLLKQNIKVELQRIAEGNVNAQDAYTVLYSSFLRD